MEKKQQIPGLNAESRTRGMLKGFDESVQEWWFYTILDIAINV